tara:strand:- start:12 stop:323 length:312 start_codon:yes stop_codon:yes gene_type:complete
MKRQTTTKKTVEVDVPCQIESDEGPYDALLGKYCLIMCLNYIYAGIVSGVNSSVLLLKDPELVYQTGDWEGTSWEDSQKLPTDECRIGLGHIENAFVVSWYAG